MSSIPIKTPAPYAVSQAVAYADADGTALVVSASTPLPVNGAISLTGALPAFASPPSVTIANAAPLAVSVNPPTTTALSGSASASGIIGPFTPVLGRAAVLMLAGSWTGTVKVSRSTDGGATRQPLTVAGLPWAQFSGNACEAVWEESDPSARLFLEITLTSGTVTYRLSQ